MPCRYAAQYAGSSLEAVHRRIPYSCDANSVVVSNPAPLPASSYDSVMVDATDVNYTTSNGNAEHDSGGLASAHGRKYDTSSASTADVGADSAESWAGEDSLQSIKVSGSLAVKPSPSPLSTNAFAATHRLGSCCGGGQNKQLTTLHCRRRTWRRQSEARRRLGPSAPAAGSSFTSSAASVRSGTWSGTGELLTTSQLLSAGKATAQR